MNVTTKATIVSVIDMNNLLLILKTSMMVLIHGGGINILPGVYI